MGNSFNCCRNAGTVNYNSELALNCETNCGLNVEDLQNKTIRRDSLFNQRKAVRGNTGTELNENSKFNFKFKDDFMRNFASVMRAGYVSDEIDFKIFESVLNGYKDVIPNLSIRIFNEDEDCNSDNDNDDRDNYKDIDKNDDKQINKDDSNYEIEKRRRLEINPYGIVGSVRNNGTSYFGIIKNENFIINEDIDTNINNISQFKNNQHGCNIKNRNLTQTINNKNSALDFILDLDYTEYDDILNPESRSNNKNQSLSIPLFAIRFDISTMRYYLKDLFSGLATISKVSSETVLKHNSIIKIGESYVLINFGEIQSVNISIISNITNPVNSPRKKGSTVIFSPDSDLVNINIKVFNKKGQSIHDPINFQPSKSIIRFGRSKVNEIVVNDFSISRTHCTIQYDDIVGWTLRDGSYSRKLGNNNKYIFDMHNASTNGTWLYVGEGSAISDGMLFKSGTMTFKCNLSEQIDEQFEQVSSGASETVPCTAGDIKIGGYMLINGRPCKVVSYSTAKTGKHGHARASIVGIDIFNSKKMEDSVPCSHNCEQPIIKRTEWQVLSVDGDNYVTVMDPLGNTRADLKLPEDTEADADIAKRIVDGLEAGKEILVTVLAAMSIEKIADVKEVN